MVLGACQPRTRNAQVEIYQSGDVDYLVATDAIGMGLNLDVDHIAFRVRNRSLTRTPFPSSSIRRVLRRLLAAPGAICVTAPSARRGRSPPFDAELVEAIENHRFEPVRQLQMAQYRSRSALGRGR